MHTGTFFLSLAEKLVRHPKRIVFPEGTNPQVVRAAARYAHLRLGPVVLLGKPDLVKKQAKMQKVDLDRVMVLDPVHGQDRQMFIDHFRMQEGNEKLKLSVIQDRLSDPILYATLMLRFNQVDGLVAGVGAYSGSVLRPLIKMIPRLPQFTRISSATILECPDKTVGDGGNSHGGGCGGGAHPKGRRTGGHGGRVGGVEAPTHRAKSAGGLAFLFHQGKCGGQ